MTDLPIVCTLQPGDLNSRAMEMLPGIAAVAAHRIAIENGYHLDFAGGAPSLTEIATMMDAERKCCRFLRFRLTAEPDEGLICLELTGPPVTQEFLATLMDK